ncbi:hypothetical protein [Lysobacter enzymogenes]|nr:hypothetical protein [Lysobacter enzymogenes]
MAAFSLAVDGDAPRLAQAAAHSAHSSGKDRAVETRADRIDMHPP